MAGMASPSDIASGNSQRRFTGHRLQQLLLGKWTPVSGGLRRRMSSDDGNAGSRAARSRLERHLIGEEDVSAPPQGRTRSREERHKMTVAVSIPDI
jgi:hypothetical protein